jgi:LacI family transcriptional regulator
MPGERVGYEAAGLLDQLLSGQTVREKQHTLPPIGVITRQSSDTLAIDDEDVAASVRFIRNNVGRPMNVDDILQDVQISRRSLERRFRQVLGRSPLEEIRRAHLERAQHLLAGTDLSMPAVAKKAGFISAERLSVIFRQETGMTPTSYRRQFRLHEEDEGE